MAGSHRKAIPVRDTTSESPSLENTPSFRASLPLRGRGGYLLLFMVCLPQPCATCRQRSCYVKHQLIGTLSPVMTLMDAQKGPPLPSGPSPTFKVVDALPASSPRLHQWFVLTLRLHPA
jgi:hypothetical protein